MMRDQEDLECKVEELVEFVQSLDLSKGSITDVMRAGAALADAARSRKQASTSDGSDFTLRSELG